MQTEIEKLVANSKAPEALARIFGYAADRLDQIRREIFPKHAKITDKQEGGE